METTEGNSYNGCVSIIEIIYTCFEKMSASLCTEEPQNYFLSFKHLLLMGPQYCHSLHREILVFWTLLITLIWISFLSLDVQHLFINVSKYVNHHMFIYINILSKLGKNKRSYSISGKGATTPENQTVISKGQLTFQSRSKAVAYALVSDLLHAKLYGDYSTQFQD